MAVLKQLRAQQRDCEHNVEELLRQMSSHQAEEADHGASDDEPVVSDVELALSLPGVGTRIAAVMFSEGARAIEQRDLEQFRNRSVAPVTVKTGKQKHTSKRHKPFVRRRYAANKRLVDAMYHCGRVAAQKSEYYRGLYAKMRARGLGHARSCRQVADRVLSVFFAMLKNRKLYDPNLHGATRRRRTE